MPRLLPKKPRELPILLSRKLHLIPSRSFSAMSISSWFLVIVGDFLPSSEAQTVVPFHLPGSPLGGFLHNFCRFCSDSSIDGFLSSAGTFFGIAFAFTGFILMPFGLFAIVIGSMSLSLFFGLTPLYYISSAVGRSCWARHNR